MKRVSKIRQPEAQAPVAAQSATDPGHALMSSDTASPSTQSEDPSGDKAANPSNDGNAPPTTHSIAVLTLGEAGEILSAREACCAVFGRESSALVGQNVRVLLKGGLDNEVGRFLHRHRAGKNPTGTSALRVMALRKDGAELPAAVTTLTWSWDTTLKKKADASRLNW